MKELSVHLARDDETGRWYIAESDIPGLWLEAPSALELIARIAEAAPEMIELNSEEIFGQKIAEPASIRPVFDSPLQLAAA